MSPTELEIFIKKRGWIKVAEAGPNDPPGSLSNSKKDGSRDLYLIECAKDDSRTTLYLLGYGLDADLGKVRLAKIDPTKLKVIKEIKRGDSFEMEITTDRGIHTKIRIYHK